MTICKPSDRRLTPEWILEAVREMAGGQIALDPCTEPSNPTGALDFFTEDGDNAYWAGWVGCAKGIWQTQPATWLPLVWCNPPFSQLPAWVDKVLGETEVPVAMLTPVDYTTAWWKRLDRGAHLRCELNRRVKCLDPETGRSMDVARCCAVWCTRATDVDLGVDLECRVRFRRSFAKLGRVVKL